MELPTISGAAYSTSVVEPAQWVAPADLGIAFHKQLPKQGDPADFLEKMRAAQAQGLQVAEPRRLQANQAYVTPETQKVAPGAIQPKAPPAMPTPARIVKVFIADTNENLPLDKRVLYGGEEKLTDLTDQELFFEVPIVGLLNTHNAFRVTVRDKKAGNTSGEPVLLEPARIRDLKMVVVTVASFV